MHGRSTSGLYLADPTFPILSHCAVITLFKKCPSASIAVTSTLREDTIFSDLQKCIFPCNSPVFNTVQIH